MTNKRVKDRVHNRGYGNAVVGPDGGLVFTMTANPPRTPSQILVSAQNELQRLRAENELRILRENQAPYQSTLAGVTTTNMDAIRFNEATRMYSSLGQPASDPAPSEAEIIYTQAMETLRLRNEERRAQLERLMRYNHARRWIAT